MYFFLIGIFTFSNTYPEMKLLGHIVALFLVFLEPPILFSIVVAAVYIPTNSIGGFPLLHILTNITICIHFEDRHSDRGEVISHNGLDLHFPDD